MSTQKIDNISNKTGQENNLNNTELTSELSELKTQEVGYNIGDIIFHREHDFRGVIVDVDPQFEGTQEWYDMYTNNQPPKNGPWYHILVDEEASMAYVSEQNICADSDTAEVENPMIDDIFSKYDSGHYLPRQTLN
jgi:heat shock protein HspQ